MILRLGAAATAVAGLAVTLAACGSSAQGKSGSTSQPPALHGKVVSAPNANIADPACGPRAPEILATTIGGVAMQIYAGERSSTGVRADQSQVEGYGPLLSALASGNRAGVKAAVEGLVFSHTHIVRLRVMQGSSVLADVGGPYILAPVGGTLRLNGRPVGRYLLSVQDDLGYVKLETRFVGVPLVLHAGSQRVPLEGTLAPGPTSIPGLGPVSYGGVSYESFSFGAEAFPRAALRISLLIPLARSLSTATCVAIKSSALGHIAQRVWRRFSLASAPPSAYVNSIRTLTGGLSYVRSGGRQLAGSTQPGPSLRPGQGNVRYRGVSYAVSSFAASSAAGPVWVYMLVR